MNGSDPLSILHVDDDGDLGTLVKTHLEGSDCALDCTVTIESDPERALELVTAAAPTFDCVITDYRMPSMNGVEFYDALQDERPNLPVVLFSAEEPTKIAAEIVDAGLTDYLEKGVGTDQYSLLCRRVEHAVEEQGQFDSDPEVTPEGLGIIGRDERYESVDDAYAALYGYTAAEIAGKHWSELHPPEEVEHIRSNVLPVVENGGKWIGRSVGLRADQTTFLESKMVTTLDDGRLLIAASEASDSQPLVESD
jgi:PAS domain S-box-containing protein